MKAKNVKIGMMVQMKEDYVGSSVRKGNVYSVIKRQTDEYNYFVLDHDGEKSYLAPSCKQFRPHY